VSDFNLSSPLIARLKFHSDTTQEESPNSKASTNNYWPVLNVTMKSIRMTKEWRLLPLKLLFCISEKSQVLISVPSFKTSKSHRRQRVRSWWIYSMQLLYKISEKSNSWLWICIDSCWKSYHLLFKIPSKVTNPLLKLMACPHTHIDPSPFQDPPLPILLCISTVHKLGSWRNQISLCSANNFHIISL
jgi:hypothetical protein